jgi:hypothetical protein
MFARLENNFVKEIFTGDILPDFHPDFIWIACPVGTLEGFFYDEEINEFISPDDLISLADLKDQIKNQVSLLRDKKLKDGFVYEGQAFQIDTDAQKDMLSMQTQFILENDSAYDGFWMDASNQPKIMTRAQAQDFFQAAFTFVKGLKGAAWTHKAAIDALQSKEACNAYDFTIGWP